MRATLQYYTRLLGLDPSLFHVVFTKYLMKDRARAISKKTDMTKLGTTRLAHEGFLDDPPEFDFKEEFFTNSTINALFSRIEHTAQTRHVPTQNLIFLKTPNMIATEK
ncbi:hypothetical protein HDV00_004116 [Rhizophlyctis rosea]|nr:hypothetical protein HDV00_004116 [Rhizophlyctis rosea]